MCKTNKTALASLSDSMVLTNEFVHLFFVRNNNANYYFYGKIDYVLHVFGKQRHAAGV